MIQVPDFSFWQNDPTTPQDIDFTKVREKTPAVILRAGQGNYADRDFVKNWQAAKEAGLQRGAYWFFDSRVNPNTQAKIFADLLKNDPPELVAWFDAEEKYGGEYTGWGHWYDFIERFRSLVPEIQVGIYTGYYYWTEYTQTYPAIKPTAKQLEYFAQFPLWIAWYNPAPPKIPKPFTDWLVWQYTDDFPSDGWGVESREIDMNWYKLPQSESAIMDFNGTKAEYRRIA